MDRTNILDLSALDTKSAAEAGTVVALDNPFTNDPLVDGNDEPITITLLGEDSAKVQAVTRKTADRRLDRIQKGRKSEIDTETLTRENIDRLVAATVAWHLMPIDGVVLDCTEQNARKLYTDPRFPWIAEQLNRALGDRTRFFTSNSPR